MEMDGTHAEVTLSMAQEFHFARSSFNRQTGRKSTWCAVQRMRSLVCMAAIIMGCVAEGYETNGTMLTEWPMVFAHNAATGYLEYGELSFAKNQGPGLRGQLDCGARAFDVRPEVIDGEVMFHHGIVQVRKLMSEALEEVVTWCNENVPELVVLMIKFCNGDSCESRTEDLLDVAGIQYYDTNSCGVLESLTVSEARERGKLGGGGSVLAFFDCFEANYEPEVQCFPVNPSSRQRSLQGRSSCLDSDTKSYPFELMWDHLIRATSRPLNNSVMTAANAHWQYDLNSIAFGVGLGESLLGVNRKSDVQTFAKDLIDEGHLRYINLFQVDGVCDQPYVLYASLRFYAERNGLQLEGSFDISTVPQPGAARSVSLPRILSWIIAWAISFYTCEM